MIAVPDTSVVVDGRFKSLLLDKDFVKDLERIVIAEATVAEIEHLANDGKSSGISGIAELKAIFNLSKEIFVPLDYYGKRPTKYEIAGAKKGDIDSIIREAAMDLGATLITGDMIQKDIAEAKGIDSIHLKPYKKVKLRIEDFFDHETLSVHLKDGITPVRKKGKPGSIILDKFDKIYNEDEIKEISLDILERAKTTKDSFIELDEKGASVVQLQEYRIVITSPPFSDGFEVTAVRPVKKLTLDDYNLADPLMKRLEIAEGILIAGAPGMGKSTFAQAIAEYYASLEKIVKTMEKPRDLNVQPEITQYTALEGDMAKTGDILLLVRPDFTVFDEMRVTNDFKIYADMRLAGVGMVGVVHATKPIDAIQRFIGRIELGIIPQLIDTIIFIKNGEVNQVLDLEFLVKVPYGMSEADLARPIVEIKDFYTKTPLYEIYTYGEQVVVMPLKTRRRETSPMKRLALSKLKEKLNSELDMPFELEVVSDSRVALYVKNDDIPSIIGKEGKNIKALENSIGFSIDVRPMEKSKSEKKGRIPVQVDFKEKHITINVEKKFARKNVKIFIEDDYLDEFSVPKSGKIKISNKNPLSEQIEDGIMDGKNLYIIL
ncbi:MAG: Flp pilus assembly complex ATPase component TadA [Candidatus Methanofastidiosa archaeon]|jgi:ATPase|nr:Flp pilus assembly complex ATPase component TadA [Candidatus Methanofastidiosa archaeon]HOM96160.1 PINc/VapC family ATPase [Methanofastidiosum sp.]HPC80313.1 PINc/VapC family ATPase [Methanofastidiosum sp.]HRS25968.1 PINc/VapC family ATPase [Methanofastidiosum sp.]